MSTFIKSTMGFQKKGRHWDYYALFFRQGPSGIDSTDVFLEIISEGCTDEVVVRQPIKDLIAVGKLELKLKTSPTDFSLKTVRGKF